MFPQLETDRLHLIEIQDCHLNDLFRLFSDDNVTRFYNLHTYTDPSDGKKFIDWYKTRYKQGLGIRWGIALKGQNNIIGTIGFNNYTKNHRANIGYDLQTKHWNHGYITEALTAIISYGFDTLQINRIEAEVMIGNTVSEKVLEKLNFTKEGILRDWMLWNDCHYNITMYSLLKNDTIK